MFAANLRRLRHEKGLSQDDLAYEAEVSRSYLSQIEKGAFYASLKIIGRLAEALGVDPARVFVSHPIQDRTDEEMRALADAAVDEILAAVVEPGSLF